MPSVVSPQWQEKATGFFSSSGSLVGGVAKDAKGNVSDVAERVVSVPSTRQEMQEHLVSAAITTNSF
ncbi:Rho GTPase-activating protein domain-containing protein [Artemisia annua]|uniref:Rho GTPase-activating protein domain-containing protein n=1 Tax=Artemisia annua TaxID=35608 RepID=A0A2U1LN58_ARTAN|nr:Rho GTPase-activating protein domain-containing protein [Artemisia annua]